MPATDISAQVPGAQIPKLPRDAGTAAPSVILNAVRFTAAAVPGSPAATAAERAGTSDIATGVINATGRLKSGTARFAYPL